LVRRRPILVWAGLAIAVGVPLGVAATSPLLQWSDPIYVAAGFAGLVALALLLVQPLLATGLLPGLDLRVARRLHAQLGAALVVAVAMHVAGLWITSPPDVVDVLLLRSPTPFALWGVAAMWAAFAAAALAAARRRLRLAPRTWRRAHTLLVAVVALGTVVHALLIEGTMGTASKAALCALVLAASAWAIANVWVPRMVRGPKTRRSRSSAP
jgi:predicted ferric reductase